MVPMIKGEISRLRKKASGKANHDSDDADSMGATTTAAKAADETERLQRIEHLTEEMNERLKAIESRLPPGKEIPQVKNQ